MQIFELEIKKISEISQLMDAENKSATILKTKSF